jgi:transposase
MSQTRRVRSIGIDASKAKLDTALLHTDKTYTNRTFANNPLGIKQLADWLTKHGVTKATPCVIESTGDIHLLASLTLSRSGFLVNVINPLITKRYEKSSVRGAKTDVVDARRLAEIGIMETGLKPFSATVEAVSARKALSLLGTLERVRQQVTMSQNAFREAKETLGLSVEYDGDEILSAVNEQITCLKAYLVEHSSADTRRFARNTPGLSPDKAAVLYNALSGLSFHNRNQLVAYVGLDVRPRRSGQWQGREKLSKRGNPYLRKTLYHIAWGLYRHHPDYRAYYDRLRADGKHYTTCLIAIARKFLRYYYACAFEKKYGYAQLIG